MIEITLSSPNTVKSLASCSTPILGGSSWEYLLPSLRRERSQFSSFRGEFHMPTPPNMDTWITEPNAGWGQFPIPTPLAARVGQFWR